MFFMAKSTVPSGSPKFKLGNYEWNKVYKGALIAFGGAVATFLEELIPGVNFGQWTAVIIPLNSVIINLIRQYVQNNSK